MEINWRVRLKNRQFWLGAVGAVGTCALSLADAFDLGAYASPWVEAIEGAAAAVLAVLAFLGVVVDPTTEGVGDSSQALQYEVPRPKDSGQETDYSEEE